MIRFLITVFVFISAGFVCAGPVSAYTSQTTGGTNGKVLNWRSKEIVVSISESGVGSISKRELESVVRESFEKWSQETGIRFRFETVSQTRISSRRSGGDGISLITAAPTAQNLLLFGERKTSLSAVTRLFFDSDGNITEADIVLNPTARFTTDGSSGSFDLSATMTHEAGHFLGLGHSRITASTMYRHQGKNGTFALPATYARSLAEDDKVGIRSLYGVTKQGERTYGSIHGRLTSGSRLFSLEKVHVWLESAANGAVIAGVETDHIGNFTIASVRGGSYRVIAAGQNGEILAASPNEVRVVEGEQTQVELEFERSFERDHVTSFGFNGQISNIAVPVESGHSYVLFVRGRKLDPGRIRIECSSPAVSVDSLTLTKHYSRNDQDVLSFEVNLSPNTQFGDYSFRVYRKDSLISYLPGVITVDDVANPWHSGIF